MVEQGKLVELARALLFVPASRPERFAKAAASNADAIIIDLEDALAPQEKEQARQVLACDFSDLPVILRINAIGTPWHEGDITAANSCQFDAIMLPKAEDPKGIEAVSQALGGKPVIALVETAKGLALCREIAALKGVVRIAFGSIDFCADLGLAHEREPLLMARSQLVLASRLAGIAPPIDGVSVQIADRALVSGDAAHAKALGMSGKLCIHPTQVEPVLQAFCVSESEIDWARRVLASGEEAVQIDGQMVDEPVRIRARQILAMSETQ